MTEHDTTPLLRSLVYQFEQARSAGDQAAMETISDLTRAEQERIVRGDVPQPDPAALVELYEDNAGGLYLVSPDHTRGLTYDVSSLLDDERFEPVAVALLSGDLDASTLDTYPTPLMDLDQLTRIAQYDGAQGVVAIERGVDGVQPAAGSNGRRFLGIPEE